MESLLSNASDDQSRAARLHTPTPQSPTWVCGWMTQPSELLLAIVWGLLFAILINANIACRGEIFWPAQFELQEER